MYNTLDRDLWVRFRKSMYNVYVLNHSQDAARSFGLSNVWDRPIRSMGYRVNGTSVECIGRPISLDSLTGYLEKCQNLKLHDPYMIIESLAIRICSRKC